MSPHHYLLFALPILSGFLLVTVLQRDRRRSIIEKRLAAIKRSGETPVAAPVSLERLRLAVFRGVSVGKLLPQQIRQSLERGFEATGNSIGITHLLLGSVISALIVNVFVSRVLELDSVLVLTATVIAATIMPVVVLRMRQSTYRNKFLDVFPDALDLIRRGVRAGLPVNEALVVVGEEIADPVGIEVRRTLEQVQLGVPIIDALEKTAIRVRITDFQFMVVAL